MAAVPGRSGNLLDRRTVRALAKAPMIPVVVGCVIVVTAFEATDAGPAAGLGLLLVLFVGAPLSYCTSLLIGLPLHLLLRHLRFTSLRAYVVAGAVAAASIVAVLYSLNGQTSPKAETWIVDILPIIIIGLAGPITASVFWHMARPDRPEESFPSENLD